MINSLVVWLKIFILVFCSIPLIVAAPVASEVLTTPELIKALQSGGHIIYMRHGPTDHLQKDKDRHNLKDGLGVWPKPERVIVVFQKQDNRLVKGMISPDQWPDPMDRMKEN